MYKEEIINRLGEIKVKNVTIAFRTLESMKKRLEEVAAKKNVSLSWVIREALEEYLKRE